MKLLVATGNQGKLKEFARILEPLGIRILSPDDLNLQVDVEETGATFAENAYLKASALHELSGLPTVADDSGLCVSALDGRPGIHSARYHGHDSSYAEKMAALLEEMQDAADRSAYFIAAICCVVDSETVIACEGRCDGTIAFAPSGSGGFGFDPVFLADGKSFAELSDAEKDAVSHRGKALRSFAVLLKNYLINERNSE